MIISFEQAKQFCCGFRLVIFQVIISFRMMYSFGVLIFWYRELPTFNGISLGVLLPDQHSSRKCWGCKDDSESHKNVTLRITFLRVMFKRSREKSNSKRQRNSSMLL